MSNYYNRKGEPIAMMEWATALEQDRRIAQADLPNGRWVSTVWMGLDHRFGSGPPLIFETMVFTCRESMAELDSDRYSTEAEAIAGHARMVEKWTAEP